MNQNEKYFVSLMSSYLNRTNPPQAGKDTDWAAIYELSAIHNVAAITADPVLKLEQGSVPDEETLSKFRQQIGYTVIDAAEKEETAAFIKDFMRAGNIDFIFIKGAVLRNYYPIKEFRTGSDTDVIIRQEDFAKCRTLFEAKGYDIKTDGFNGFSVSYKNQHIEIHSTLDYDNPVFENIFDMCEKNANEYLIKKEYHLLYVLCHIIKHFNHCGAGIKMFMDIDVLLRSTDNFDYEEFMALCRKINIETFAKASFALCRYWFNTPVDSDLDLRECADFRELFETEIIKSGSFGFHSRDLGDYYINKGIGGSGKNSAAAKLKALLFLIFPPIKDLARKYGYLNKKPYLLPVAWISRLCAAVFSRSSHSRNTVKAILHTGSESEQYKKLLKELNI